MASPAPLPTIAWAAAFVALAVESDVRGHRIPNWLTFPTMIGAIGLGSVLDGFPGAAQAGVGLLLGLICFLPLYAVGVLGAGDVKAMMAMGALVGPAASPGVALRALVCAALLGIAWLAWRRELRAFAARWTAIVLTTLAARKLNYLAPPDGSAATAGIPFAAALAAGLAWAWGV
jgi:prepilin peptidase CpaA